METLLPFPAMLLVFEYFLTWQVVQHGPGGMGPAGLRPRLWAAGLLGYKTYSSPARQRQGGGGISGRAGAEAQPCRHLTHLLSAPLQQGTPIWAPFSLLLLCGGAVGDAAVQSSLNCGQKLQEKESKITPKRVWLLHYY